MARKKAVEITVHEGTCCCGCGEPVSKGRSFRQGHDARLKGILGRAHRGGIPVRIVADGSRETQTAAALLEAWGWPVPS
jgi:hypothetical protein